MSTEGFGFAILPVENETRLSYIEQLPIIAECLTQSEFENELNYILTSISRSDILIRKLLDVSSEVVKVLPKKQAFSYVYLVGGRLMSLYDNSTKVMCADTTEKILQDLNDLQFEIDNFIKPTVENKVLEKRRLTKFALWRLARLTSLSQDNETVKVLVYNAFTDQESLQFSAELLPFLSKEECQKYIVNAFLSPLAEVKASAVDAIGFHKFNESEELINTYLMTENSLTVLNHTLQFPPEIIPIGFLKRLIEHPDLGSAAMRIALKSPYLNDVIPDLIKNSCSGCELNDMSVDVILNTNPPPYDLISFMLRESSEIVHDNIIKAIAQLDENSVLFRIIFPRMGEKGSWRPRYAAVQIFKEIISRKDDSQMIPDYAGFVIAMMLDTCYAVRHLVIETLKLFPEGWVKHFTLESILSLATPDADLFHLSIIKMLIDEAPSLLVGFEAQVENAKMALKSE